MQRKTILLFELTLLTALLLSACGSQAAPTQAAVQPANAASTKSAAALANVSFANDIKPILESRCVQCHGGDQTNAGLDMKTYESLMDGSKNGAVIAPSDAGNSLLVDLLAKGKMPKKGPKLTPDQVQLITDWINAGAQNN